MDASVATNWTHSTQTRDDCGLGPAWGTNPCDCSPGMIQIVLSSSCFTIPTAIQIENCQVTGTVSTPRKFKPTYHAVQVAASDRTEKTTTCAMLGHFNKAGVPPKRIVKEFEVTEDALLPAGMSLLNSSVTLTCVISMIGTTLSACHFVPGQAVDVIGVS
jgi:ribosomal protein L3